MTGPDPADLAVRMAADQSPEWLDAFSAALAQQRAVAGLRWVLEVWNLSQSDVARLFGVSRQAVGKWLVEGIPASRVGDIGDLSAATDLMMHYLERDRIPTVVRREAGGLGGVSLLDLVRLGRCGDVLAACHSMFDFSAIPG